MGRGRRATVRFRSCSSLSSRKRCVARRVVVLVQPDASECPSRSRERGGALETRPRRRGATEVGTTRGHRGEVAEHERCMLVATRLVVLGMPPGWVLARRAFRLDVRAALVEPMAEGCGKPTTPQLQRGVLRGGRSVHPRPLPCKECVRTRVTWPLRPSLPYVMFEISLGDFERGERVCRREAA